MAETKRLKTGAKLSEEEPHPRRAEFFALPADCPSIPMRLAHLAGLEL
jgi:hypothetical protein